MGKSCRGVTPWAPRVTAARRPRRDAPTIISDDRNAYFEPSDSRGARMFGLIMLSGEALPRHTLAEKLRTRTLCEAWREHESMGDTRSSQQETVRIRTQG
jgi:hypothetical protein